MPRHRAAVFGAIWSGDPTPIVVEWIETGRFATKEYAWPYHEGDVDVEAMAQAVADAEEPGRAAQLALMELAAIPAIRDRMHVGQLLTRDLVPVVRELLTTQIDITSIGCKGDGSTDSAAIINAFTRGVVSERARTAQWSTMPPTEPGDYWFAFEGAVWLERLRIGAGSVLRRDMGQGKEHSHESPYYAGGWAFAPAVVPEIPDWAAWPPAP